MKRWGWVLVGCLLPVFAASGQELGRLFFTPAERANLDDLRQSGKPPGKTRKTGTKAAATVKPKVPAVVSVGGYVKRSDGEATVWVNGKPVQEKSITKEFEVGELQGGSNQVRLRMPGSGQVVSLKAGQSYDPVSGKILDSRPLLGVSAQNRTPAVGIGSGNLRKNPDNPERKAPSPKKIPEPAAFSENEE